MCGLASNGQQAAASRHTTLGSPVPHQVREVVARHEDLLVIVVQRRQLALATTLTRRSSLQFAMGVYAPALPSRPGDQSGCSADVDLWSAGAGAGGVREERLGAHGVSFE